MVITLAISLKNWVRFSYLYARYEAEEAIQKIKK